MDLSFFVSVNSQKIIVWKEVQCVKVQLIMHIELPSTI